MSFQALYPVAGGPLVWVSLSVFAAGVVFQVVRFFCLTRPAAAPPKVPETAVRLREPSLPFVRPWSGGSPAMSFISTLFHTLVFVTPLFLLGHNIMIENAVGLSLFSMPEGIADGLTVVVLFCCVFFLLRRVFYGRVRALSTLYDYLVLALACAPFLTGFLAYHQLAPYKTVLTIHMLSGELLLMALPFTRLMHMVFFFLARFLMGGEYGLNRGKRTW